MCGIVGLIAKTSSGFYGSQADLFTNMLRMDSIRGEDSTGIFGVTAGGKLDYLKGDADGYRFVQCEDYARFRQNIISEYKVVVGHNRKATKGVISAQNAHPFVQKHICLVHNGTIYNGKELNQEVEVDSEAIAHALAAHDAPAALQKLNGPFALVWLDKKDLTLSLARNDQRPLCLVEYETHWVISSEIGLVFWLQGRENYKSKSNLIVPVNKILVFSLNDLAAGPKEVDYEEYKHYIPPVRKPYVMPDTHYTPVVRQLPRSHVPALLDINRRSELGLKAGEVIKFRTISYKDQDETDRCLLGNPIFKDIDREEIDLNLTVQAILPKGEKVEDYLARGDIYTATIINVRPMGSKWVIFARDPVVCKVIKDLHGEENSLLEVVEALKKGCTKCFMDVYFTDASQSVIQKKKDGTWRVVCPKCVQASFNKAQAERSLILPQAANVQ